MSKKRVIRLTEHQLKQTITEVVSSLIHESSLNENKLSKVIGTAALSGALALGLPGLANSQTTNDTIKSNNIENVDSNKIIFKNIMNQVSVEKEFDDLLKIMTIHYQLVFETNVDGEIAYKRVMSRLYNENNVKTNEIDGFYQIEIKDGQKKTNLKNESSFKK